MPIFNMEDQARGGALLRHLHGCPPSPVMKAKPVLEVAGLKTRFHTEAGTVKAVDGVDFVLLEDEILGMVGESGCGKSMTAYSILRLIKDPPGRIVSGSIRFEGKDLLAIPEEEMQGVRGNRISMIFQDPMAGLNPVITIGKQIIETFRAHKGIGRKEARDRTAQILDRVGISLPLRRMDEYPYQLSGGMLQRVMIAMALACEPKVLLADEPTTSLDVTIQAQILDLMHQLKEKSGTAVVLITHNMGIVSEESRRTAVMYLGAIVETAPTRELFKNPIHPYTAGLLGSVPHLGSRLRNGKVRLREIPGNVPTPLHIPPGCRFSARCAFRKPICGEKEPPLQSIADDHAVRCWHHGSNA